MTAAMLKPPGDGEPKWYVKRWMAVTCVKVMVGGVIWTLGLMTYICITGKNVNLGDFAALLGVFATTLAAIPIKYYHDEGKADIAKINQQEPNGEL